MTKGLGDGALLGGAVGGVEGLGRSSIDAYLDKLLSVKKLKNTGNARVPKFDFVVEGASKGEKLKHIVKQTGKGAIKGGVAGAAIGGGIMGLMELLRKKEEDSE